MAHNQWIYPLLVIQRHSQSLLFTNDSNNVGDVGCEEDRRGFCRHLAGIHARRLLPYVQKPYFFRAALWILEGIIYLLENYSPYGTKHLKGGKFPILLRFTLIFSKGKKKKKRKYIGAEKSACGYLQEATEKYMLPIKNTFFRHLHGTKEKYRKKGAMAIPYLKTEHKLERNIYSKYISNHIFLY